MLDNLLLLSGNDIPFPIAQLTIHQPTLKDIGYIGEENFFVGSELLNFSKESLSLEDRSSLQDKTNFEVLMAMMSDRENAVMGKQRISAMMVLALLFPTYKIKLQSDAIVFSQEGSLEECQLNKKNYDDFQEILTDMFCLQKKSNEYNPTGEYSSKIVEKLRRRHQKLAEIKNDKSIQKISVLNRYVSILAVGLPQDINSLMQYTIYQLNDEFQRFELKENYDMFIKMKLAGAKDVKEVDNWMKELHP